MPEKKIDEQELIRLLTIEHKSVKEAAAHFGCCVQAMYQKIKKMEHGKVQVKLRPHPLTPNQSAAVKLIEQGVPVKEAVQKAFDPDDDHLTEQVKRFVNSPAVKATIADILEQQGLGKTERVKYLKRFVTSGKDENRIRALDMAFKLADDYPAQKSVSVNVNIDWFPVDLESYRIPAREVENLVDVESTKIENTSNKV